LSYEVIKAARLVSHNIDEKVKQLEEAIGRGNAKSYEEYREMCGEVKGLLTARSYITDLTKNMEQLDE
jgi:hypothetical protein